ncbi:MAG: serine hydrolase, partial [Clostridiales bacterium]|nr:serine hydrolase [Clostridiales bacterium]
MAETKTKKLLPRAESPEEVGVSSSELVEFLRDMEENGLEFHSFMVIRHGKVAAVCYREPFNAETPHAMYSVSKTFSGTAIGFAVHEGILSLDTRVIDVFPEYAPKKPCERLAKLTVRHLVTMTSGKNPSLLADKGKIDWIEDYINCPWYGDPGEYRYVNENIYML